MIHAAIFLLAFVGFSLLLLTMRRHQQDWFRNKLPPALGRSLWLSGFAALGLAFVISGRSFGWSYGALAWFGWLTATAALVAMINASRERIMHLVGKANR